MALIAPDLKGGTLGFYLLFDNARHIATSVYLLNQEPLTRRFQTIEQYREPAHSLPRNLHRLHRAKSVAARRLATNRHTTKDSRYGSKASREPERM